MPYAPPRIAPRIAPDRAPPEPGDLPEPDPLSIPWLAEAARVARPGRAGIGDRAARLRLLGLLNSRAPWTVPWCGLLVAHCLREALPGAPLPALPARARPWRRWGVPVAPQLGAVLVFWHYHPALPFGHAAFCWAEDAEAYHVLGGNQGHRVCVRRYPKARLVASRWPEGEPAPGLVRRAPPEAAPPFRPGAFEGAAAARPLRRARRTPWSRC